MDGPETRYATSGDVHIAYQVCGDGDTDLLILEGFASHLDEYWAFAPYRAWIERLARVIRFDKRGVGLSDRAVEAPTLELRVADILAVLDAVGSQHATLYAVSEGAPVALLCAATHPDRVTRLVLHGGMARCTEAPDYPWALRRTPRRCSSCRAGNISNDDLACAVQRASRCHRRWLRRGNLVELRSGGLVIHDDQ